MNEPKFTPGPWRHEDGGVIHAGSNDHIAVMKAMPEWEENAALIAAAPEMYEFINWICTVQGQCAIIKGKIFLPDILEEAHKILKKARGE